MTGLAQKTLSALPEATAADGAAVRLLCALTGGSLAHFELAAGVTSKAVKHRSVEEIWFVLSGAGEMWRALGEVASVIALRPGLSLTIPLGAAFQYRADATAPLVFLAITMPPWPGADEAMAVEGPWTASA